MLEAGQLATIKQITHVPFHINDPLEEYLNVEVIHNFISELVELSWPFPILSKFETFQNLVNWVFQEAENTKNKFIAPFIASRGLL